MNKCEHFAQKICADPLIIINALRKSDSYIVHIFKEGSCYRFYEFLTVIYPDAFPYINQKEDHVVTKINGRLYDITGMISKKEEANYSPINYAQMKKAKKWSFAKHMLIQITECPFCEEPITV